MLLTRASTAYVFKATRQSCPYGHICLDVVAYHMPTHVKSLSRHNISDALPDRNSGSNKIGQAALPHKNIHLDLWTDKLLKLKQNWFDKSSSDQQPEYAPNSILDKWKPLLQQSYPSIDKNNWKNFIDNHFYLQYVDDE